MAKEITTRITRQERAEMRAETMACWWPDRVTGLKQPAWGEIAGELKAHVDAEIFYFAERGYNYTRLHHLQRLHALAETKARYG